MATGSKTGSVLPLKTNQHLRKAKTLSEKRYFLQQDIMKYGVAAIEKLYPRQPIKRFQKGNSPNKPAAITRGTPVKMKPKPIGKF